MGRIKKKKKGKRFAEHFTKLLQTKKKKKLFQMLNLISCNGGAQSGSEIKNQGR